MYTDYPVIYESKANFDFIYLIILAVILILIIILSFLSLYKIFKKANRSGFSAIIPIYNIIVLLELVNRPSWQVVLFFIPILNFVITFRVMNELAASFKKSKGFALGLFFLPVVFLPILAFGNSEYIGINLIAMSGRETVVEEIDTEIDEEKIPTVNEKYDKVSQQIGISIGGGVYQDDYTKSLLGVDRSQTVVASPLDNESFNKVVPEISNPFIIKDDLPPIEPEEDITSNQSLSIQVPPKIQETHSDDLFTVNTEISSNQNSTMNNINNDQVISIPNDYVNSNSINDIFDINIPKVKEVIVDTPSTPIVSPTEIVVANNTNNFSDNSNIENDKCPKCGTPVRKGAAVCFLCGNHLH